MALVLRASGFRFPVCGSTGHLLSRVRHPRTSSSSQRLSLLDSQTLVLSRREGDKDWGKDQTLRGQRPPTHPGRSLILFPLISGVGKSRFEISHPSFVGK